MHHRINKGTSERNICARMWPTATNSSPFNLVVIVFNLDYSHRHVSDLLARPSLKLHKDCTL